MNILIFGSSGFIAKHFINYFKKNSSNIIYGFDIKTPTNNLQVINFSYCDVRDYNTFNIKLKKIDLIINLAAIHREPGHERREYFETNILGAENVCRFAEKINCSNIIFTSSISPYGVDDNLKDEATVPCPNSPYGSSKLAAEKIHISWQNRSIKKRILTIVRPGVVFGEGEKGNMSRLVKLIYKNFFFYMGNKDTRKAGIYVKELINQILWVHQRQNNNLLPKLTLFNATMWPNPSISDYVDTIKSIAKIKRFIPNLAYTFLLCFGFIFELIFKIIGKNNPFSPVRLRKLVRPNLVKPSFLIKNKYKSLFSLRSALKDWEKNDPEVWR